jgi:hypothetical protein
LGIDRESVGRGLYGDDLPFERVAFGFLSLCGRRFAFCFWRRLLTAGCGGQSRQSEYHRARAFHEGLPVTND